MTERHSERWGNSLEAASLKQAKAKAASSDLRNLPESPSSGGHSLVYRSATGAKVVKESGWESGHLTEVPIAKHLADNGQDVILRKKIEEHGVQTPDAYVRDARKTSWRTWDFKNVSNKAINVPGAVQLQIRRGRKQSPHVLVYLSIDSVAPGVAEDAARGVRSAVINDIDRRVKSIIILSQSGKISEGDADEIRLGKPFIPEL